MEDDLAFGTTLKKHEYTSPESQLAEPTNFWGSWTKLFSLSGGSKAAEPTLPRTTDADARLESALAFEEKSEGTHEKPPSIIHLSSETIRDSSQEESLSDSTSSLTRTSPIDPGTAEPSTTDSSTGPFQPLTISDLSVEAPVPSKPRQDVHHLFDSGLLGNHTDSSVSSRSFKFRRILSEPQVDLDALRKISWHGIPEDERAITWKLLLQYLPSNRDRRAVALDRKREEYRLCVEKYYNIDAERRTPEDEGIYKQIHKDVPRTNPNIPMFQNKAFQECLARILYVWSIRHPASGYVQGIDGLATVILIVFLLDVTDPDVLKTDGSTVDLDLINIIEADTYWCLTKLLDGIQDNYTSGQPGVQRMISRLSELIRRVDASLHQHLEDQEVYFLQFSFQWMNCLLRRELPLPLVVRMWDTYFTEVEAISDFHVYVCASFLLNFSTHLKRLESIDIMMFLKTPPTDKWTDKDIQLLLSHTYQLQALFGNSPKHLEDTGIT